MNEYVDDKDGKKSIFKSVFDKPETKTKAKEVTPKTKKEQGQFSLTIDTNLESQGKNEQETSVLEPTLTTDTNDDTNANTNEPQSIQQTQIDYTSIIKQMNLDDIFINLNLIAKVEVGDKLYINDKYINIDKRYAKSIIRWYYGVDRKSTINFVRMCIIKSFEFCDSLLKSETKMLFRLTNDLKNSISGLTKLKQTYCDDKLVQAEIDVIIEDIRAKIEKTLLAQ